MAMGKLVESTYVTLDGVISDPQNWGMQYWDDDHVRYADGLLQSASALLLGRETYDVFAEVWPQRAGDAFADRLNSLPKYVASTTLSETTWNATLLQGDVAEGIAEAKRASSGTLLKYGTGMLDRTLLQHGLLDELQLWIYPVIAGRGTRLLEGLELTQLKLVDTTVFASGIVVHVYRP
jgi:dihydrofolate reductase